MEFNKEINTSGTIENTEKFLDTMFIEGIVHTQRKSLSIPQEIHVLIKKSTNKRKQLHPRKQIRCTFL